jgi:Putative peptidoglycan binding domain
MTVVKQLVKLAIFPVAMAAGAGLCLWVLLGPLRIDLLAVAGHSLATPATPGPPPVPSDPPADVSEPVTPVADHPPVMDAGPADVSRRVVSAIADLPLVAGDSGPLVTQLQGALIEKGYWVGPAGADGKFDAGTLTALGAFQDNNALPMQPGCDQQGWTSLGLSGPE